MKKMLAWTLLGVIALSLVGCKSDTDTTQTPSTDTSSKDKGAPPTDNKPISETGK